VGVVPGRNGDEHVFVAVLPDGDWSLAEGAGSAWFPLDDAPEPMPEHHRAALALVRRRVGAAALASG
jgi:hypothetical protein